jgi:DNA-binding NarL/FixJ family response regulator
VQLIAEGDGKELAGILNLSVKTIECRRAAALRKFNVGSTAEIVRYAVRNQLVAPLTASLDSGPVPNVRCVDRSP